MKLSVLTVPLYGKGAAEAFAWLAERGVEQLELGTGGYPGTGHCDPAELLADASARSWAFRTVGYGHGELEWRDIISALRLAGYDGAVSIEHEDALMSAAEAVEARAAARTRRRVGLSSRHTPGSAEKAPQLPRTGGCSCPESLCYS